MRHNLNHLGFQVRKEPGGAAIAQVKPRSKIGFDFVFNLSIKLILFDYQKMRCKDNNAKVIRIINEEYFHISDLRCLIGITKCMNSCD